MINSCTISPHKNVHNEGYIPIMKKFLTIVITTVLGSLLFTLVFVLPAHANTTMRTTVAAKPAPVVHDGLTPKIVAYAVNAYRWAVKHNEVANPSVLTIVDFKKPSFDKRLWVIDLKNDQVLLHTYVAQGKNTGAVYAKRFSNQPGSLESSPGIFTTARSPFYGEHGKALRIHGLEPGINSNAYDRAIEIHQAPYVTPAFIKQNGYAGRSWGCFAVNPARANEFIRLVKGGSVLFAYARPETDDSRVDHSLSENGTRLYDAILEASPNPVERFFSTV